MGKAIIAVFFILGFIIFSIIKYAAKGTTAAYQAVNSEKYLNNPQLPTAIEDEDSRSIQIVKIASGILIVQKFILSPDDQPLADKAIDRWSIGYIGGFTDALMQRSDIRANEEGSTIMLMVFMVLFGESEGKFNFNRFMKFQNDPFLLDGMMRGGTEYLGWATGKGSPNPMGWVRHVQED